MTRDFLGMAIEEIRVARTEESIGTQDGNVSARNKVLQNTGVGVKLVYKAPILGESRTPTGSGQKGFGCRSSFVPQARSTTTGA